MTPDHDLLIELNTKVNVLMGRIDTIVLDHETRLRSLEAAKWKLAGALLCAQCLAGWVVYWAVQRLH